MLTRLRAFFGALLRRRRMESEMDQELRFHMEAYADDLARSGVPRAEAERRAGIEFGGVARTKEDCRQSLGLRLIDELRQDLRYAARSMRRNPGFAAAAVVSLALGIGANTALFSLLDSLLYKPAPVPHPGQLVRVAEGEQDAFTYTAYDRLDRGTRLCSAVLAMEKLFRPVTIEERGEPVSAVLQLVSANYFDALGLAPSRGRVFHAADGRSQAEQLAVISDSFWRRHYGANPAALGARFRYGIYDVTVIGVAPPGFRGMTVDFAVDIWMPLEQILPPGSPELSHGRWVQVLGRLQPGVRPAQAAAEAGALMNRRVTVAPCGSGFSALRGRYLRPFLVLECVAGFVLLIACVNLANLLLAGAASRQREIATRQAIGAGRGRLVRQLLAENLLLVGIGGAAAILAAHWFSLGILGFLPPAAVPALANLSFHADARVLTFTILLSLFTCLLFGLAPALRATAAPATGLKEPAGGVRGRWTVRTLAVAEVAICTLLLIASGLFVRTLRNLKTLDAGFKAEGLLTAGISLLDNVSPLTRIQAYDALRERALRLHGVRAAAYSQIGQLSGHALDHEIAPEGAPSGPGRARDALGNNVSPGFLAAIGTPLLSGRDFTDRDDAERPQVAIVNESFARRFFPGENPLGRRFRIDIDRDRLVEVVGVVRDTRWIDLRERPQPMYYRPCRQERGTFTSVTFAVRASDDSPGIAEAFRQAASEVNPRFTVLDVVPFTEIVDRTLATERAVASISAAFGALAISVGCIGLYGVLSYGVARRRREIGIRMALGATRAGVGWTVLRESLAILAAGLAIGVPLALAGARFVAAMLFGVTPADPVAVALALGIVSATALAAAWLPARRAAAIEPLTTLRHE